MSVFENKVARCLWAKNIVCLRMSWPMLWEESGMGPVARSPLLGSDFKVSRCAGPPMVCAEDVVPPPDVLGRALARARSAARFFFRGARLWWVALPGEATHFVPASTACSVFLSQKWSRAGLNRGPYGY